TVNTHGRTRPRPCGRRCGCATSSQCAACAPWSVTARTITAPRNRDNARPPCALPAASCVRATLTCAEGAIHIGPMSARWLVALGALVLAACTSMQEAYAVRRDNVTCEQANR